MMEELEQQIATAKKELQILKIDVSLKEIYIKKLEDDLDYLIQEAALTKQKEIIK
jgi:hypothetical protein